MKNEKTTPAINIPMEATTVIQYMNILNRKCGITKVNNNKNPIIQ